MRERKTDASCREEIILATNLASQSVHLLHPVQR